MDRGGAPPTRETAPIRWGIPDAAVAWVVSLAAALVAQAPFVERNGIPRHNETIATFLGLLFQTTAAIAVIAVVARSKGRGSLRADFGLRVRLADASFLVLGLVLGLVASLGLEPILDLGHLHDTSQEVKRIFDRATGFELGLLVVGVIVIAPIGEELLFRGLLLRGLQRKLSTGVAVFVAALAFAFVHVALDVGSGFGVPALVLLGLVSGWRAVQTRSLSQSIWLHAGFNLLVVLARI
jgi:membrane protease YdiL (CAAX protease family)